MSLEKPEYGRLTPVFLGTFTPGEKRGTGRDAFYNWSRKDPAGYKVELSQADWNRLRSGDVVPYPMIVAYTEFLNHLYPDTPRLASAIAEVERDPTVPAPRRRPWLSGFSMVTSAIRDRLPIYAASYCRTDGDVGDAARLLMTSVGRANILPATLSDGEALAAGEAVMKRTFADFAAWLKKLHAHSSTAVMFAVVKRGNTYHRVGASIVTGLTATAYTNLRNSVVSDADLTEADFMTPSPHIFVSVIGEASSRYGKIEEAAAVQTVTYQIAMQCTKLMLGSPCPAVLSIGGTPENMRRAIAFGFKPTGTYLKGFDKPMVELFPEEARGKTALEYFQAGVKNSVQYFNLKFGLMCYQIVFAAEDVGNRKVE